MRGVRALVRFLCAFVIGDDPLIAVAVVLALTLTAILAAWWVLPPAVVGVLGWSLVRATTP